MQAIILAAGMGKRLGGLTKDNTKCMVKVHGRTLIERMLTILSELNLEKVIIVIGYEGKKVIDLLGNSYNGLKIEYVENPIYDKTNNIYSLALAKQHLLEHDTLLLESDLIIEKGILEDLIENQYASLAVVAKYQSWMDGTVVTLDSDDNILSFVPKKNFNTNDIEKYYKTVNIYKFSKEFSKTHYVPFLEAYSKALGNNEYYEQVLRVITLLEKPEIKAIRTNRKWYEIDDIQDLNNAETIFAPESEMLGLYQKRFGGYWRYPEILDFCYLVNPYFPPQKLKDEIKANFDVLLTEYPSGQGVNSLLAAKTFGVDQSQIVVGNGAAELINAYLQINPLTTGVVLPTFEEYPNRLPIEKVVTFTPNNQDFYYSISDLKKLLSKVEQLLVINPDNPSGNYIPQNDLVDLIQWCSSEGKRIIVDESFIDFSDEGERASLFNRNFLSENPCLVLIKSISKSYGVPGCRLGVLASGDEELISNLKKKVSIWNINSFGEFFMQIIDKYKGNYLNGCDMFKIERKRFYDLLSEIPFLRVVPSEANYFLCEVNNEISATQLSEKLLKDHEILIKDCSLKYTFKGKEFVRIAIRNSDDNNKLVESLKKINNDLSINLEN
jgi:histidinol-phosphate/aromatic aminotransferase/cobyric acid decarboxylase-like protein/choline kinase